MSAESFMCNNNLKSAAAKLAMILVVSSVLAGCSAEEVALDDQYVPATHYEMYPIAVTNAPVKLEISSKRGTLQPSQINAIAAFAQSAQNSSISKFMIKRPSGGGASSRVAKETYQIMVKNGISPRMIVQGTYPASSKAPVQIVYTRSVAVTKECGDWSSDWADTKANETPSNLGCSIQNNIAAMVVNPQDFEVPRATTPAYAGTRFPGLATLSQQNIIVP
jgi:pilus assembly protein CpaD